MEGESRIDGKCALLVSLTPSVALKTSDFPRLPADEAQRVNSMRVVTCSRTDLEPMRRKAVQMKKTPATTNRGLPTCWLIYIANKFGNTKETTG